MLHTSGLLIRARLALLCFVLVSTVATAQTVYVTKTGNRYHASVCRYLSKSKIKTTLSDAKERSFTACSVCGPPTEVTEDKAGNLTRIAVSVQCSGKTKAGGRCKRMTKNSSGKCYQHGT